MSEERLQEIKDSVGFQYTLAKAKGFDNALLFTDEEQELIEEVERLNNIINEIVNIYESKDTTEDVYFALEELFEKENIIK